ncbi:MAG: flagellar hook-associated family protein [Bacteroidota bacterium]|jgi:flagellar hook-associated protein 3 FlgL
MKTTFISTQAISQATRLSLMKLQSRLQIAQKEVASGRLADVGLSLGAKAGETVSLRQEHTRLTAMKDTNAEVLSRLDLTQSSLKGMIQTAQDFLSQLIGARSSESGPEVIKAQAMTGLNSFIDTLNTSFNGAYLFSGINADVKPLADYEQTPTGPAQQAVANEFLTAFGVAQGAPGTETITPAAMATFLDGAFANLFDPTGWSTNWSSASDQNMRSRISTYELVESSVNANDVSFRELASAFTMVGDLGVTTLSGDTYQTVIDRAIKLVGDAVTGMSKLQSNLGTVQERVNKANDRMSIQIDILSAHIGTLESVDPYEASTRVNGLMTQIETAYSLTARLQKMSLLNYL